MHRKVSIALLAPLGVKLSEEVDFLPSGSRAWNMIVVVVLRVDGLQCTCSGDDEE